MTAVAVPETGTPPFLQSLFGAIDRKDAEGYAAHFTPDATWKFGNADPLVGQEAVAAAANGVFSLVSTIEHRLHTIYSTPNGYIALGEVVYSRKDGKTIIVPFSGVYVVESDKLTFYQTYIDGTPLFAE